MVKERAHSYGSEGVYTYSDYLKLPDEGNCQYEILDGALSRSPNPSTLHQRVLAKLLHLLQRYFWEQDPQGEILAAPIVLTLSDTNVMQPDLVYVPGDSDIIDEQRINGVPQLIVEVLLPSTEARDRVRKLRTYNRFGVQHYWLVDPEEQFIQAYALLPSGDYVICRTVGENEVFTHPDYPDLSIELESLWKKGCL